MWNAGLDKSQVGIKIAGKKYNNLRYADNATFIAESKVKGSEVKVTQSCPTLCDPMDYIVHGILQARILEWVAFPFFRGFSQPRDRAQVSCIAGRFFTSWATRDAQESWNRWPIPFPVDLPDLGIRPGSPAL